MRSLTEEFFRSMVAAMPREERLRQFMLGVGADEEPDIEVLREALAMSEPVRDSDASAG